MFEPGRATRIGEYNGILRGGDIMSVFRILAIVLIALGIVSLIYGKFVYTMDPHKAKLGSLELSIQEKHTVNVPLWAGVGTLLVGGVILFVPHKKSWLCFS
jgi:hypothetical protein